MIDRPGALTTILAQFFASSTRQAAETRPAPSGFNAPASARSEASDHRFVLEADAENNRLLLRATADELADIRALLIKLGETGASISAASIGNVARQATTARIPRAAHQQVDNE